MFGSFGLCLWMSFVRVCVYGDLLFFGSLSGGGDWCGIGGWLGVDCGGLVLIDWCVFVHCS